MEFARPLIQIADTRSQLDTEGKFALLETFAFEPIHPQYIHIHTKEFSAVCPGTGLPDIGHLDIEYIPGAVCVELKALKYYLFSYRNDGIFQEPVTDLIFDHLWRAMAPRYLSVKMQYNIRGGFDTVTRCERGDRSVLNPATSHAL
jgi:7-cyano-7-deazaguanine reductase